MIYNTAEFTFNTLIVDGTLRIDPSIPESKIIANNIWVRGGKIVAGGPETLNTYTKNFKIELTGNKNSPPLIIDELSKTGTKSLAITGKLELYGVVPDLTQTRLTVTANVGDT